MYQPYHDGCGDGSAPKGVEQPELGCPMAGFGADAGRRPEALAAAFVGGAEMLIARIASVGGFAAERADAIRRLATPAGAVVVTRAMGRGPLRDEILTACASR